MKLRLQIAASVDDVSIGQVNKRQKILYNGHSLRDREMINYQIRESLCIFAQLQIEAERQSKEHFEKYDQHMAIYFDGKAEAYKRVTFQLLCIINNETI